MTFKKRSCSLWLRITQYEQDTDYRIKIDRPSDCKMRVVLYKYKNNVTETSYVVEEGINGHCTCNCPDWLKKRVDCKHIGALKANGIIEGVPCL
jgi:predicted nucleic acid-binding Zn finger protein